MNELGKYNDITRLKFILFIQLSSIARISHTSSPLRIGFRIRIRCPGHGGERSVTVIGGLSSLDCLFFRAVSSFPLLFAIYRRMLIDCLRLSLGRTFSCWNLTPDLI